MNGPPKVKKRLVATLFFIALSSARSAAAAEPTTSPSPTVDSESTDDATDSPVTSDEHSQPRDDDATNIAPSAPARQPVPLTSLVPESDESASSPPPSQDPPTNDVPPRRLRYTLENIQVVGNYKTNRRVVLRYVSFHRGDILDIEDEKLTMLRYRLLGTGLFQSVDLSLRKGSSRGRVILMIRVVERNTLVLRNVWMGLSADADTQGNARPLTAYAGIDAAETNLFGTGMTLGAGLAFSHDQYATRIRFFDPLLFPDGWMLSAGLLLNDAREFYGNRDVLYDDPNNWLSRVRDHAVAQYERRGGSIGLGKDLGPVTQVWVTYRIERLQASLPLAASHMRGTVREPISFGLNRGRSVLSALQATLRLDTRNSPLLPSRGWLTSASASLSLSPLGSSYPYEKFTLSVSKWTTLPWGHVLSFSGFAGAIEGYAPIYERFYVGDFTDFLPGRILGLNTDRRPSPNFLGTDIAEIRFGTYAGKVSGEYRIPLYRGSRSVYGIDLFTSAGLFALASEHDIETPPPGYSGAATVPLDLTFNLGLRMDTSAGGFSFALSNIAGFTPIRQEGGH